MLIVNTLMPFPATPVVLHSMDKLKIFDDVLKRTSVPPRPVQHLPNETCLRPTRRGALPAGNHQGNHQGQRPTTAADEGKGPPVGVGIPSTGISTGVAWRGEGTRETAKTMVAPSPLSLSLSLYPPPPPQEADPFSRATTRRTRPQERNKKKEQVPEQDVERHRIQGGGCGSGNGTVKKRGGGPGSGRGSGGASWLYFLPLVRVWLLVVCGLGRVEGFAQLPDGDGVSGTGNAGTLRRAVSDWITGGTSRSTVVATYGAIEEWDISEVTNMRCIFQDQDSFNADLSKWNTGAVTSMFKSKCNLSQYLCHSSVLVFLIRQLEFHLNSILMFWVFLFLAPSLLQCFMEQLRSIKTCQNGIRVR
jgi:surface protein